MMFKFIELYSMIQFISLTILYYMGTNYTDIEWLYQDIFIVVPLTMTIGWTKSALTLTPHLPQGALLSLPVLSSILGVVFI